jgi:serine/threonine-protein kinase
MDPTYPRKYGEYVLLEHLGTGGMSEVELARRMVEDRTYIRFVVIKRIKADKQRDQPAIRMFKDEARITGELHHENVGQVYDFGKVGDEYYLCLEYVPGMDVRDLVHELRSRRQRVPVRVALRIVHDVLRGLDYAHGRRDVYGRPMGIVHRDVNPRNILVGVNGEVKLIDFGVAMARDRLEQTRTDHVKGKFTYMAPEQISGGKVDGRADLYAAGLTLVELLAGVSPYQGLTQVQIMHRMVAGTVPDLPAVTELPDPGALERLLRRALARGPRDRFPSAGQMADAVRDIATQVGGLPTRAQMAAFLASVEPELGPSLQLRMEAYAALEMTETGEITSKINLAELETQRLRRRAPTDLEPQELASQSATVSRTGLLAGSFVVVAMISAAVAAIVVATLLTGLWFLAGTPAPPIP